MKTKILMVLLAFGMLTPLGARAQVNYAVSGNTAYVTNSYSASGDIVIASSYEWYPVTSIGYGAFENCGSLTSVVISDSVTNISQWAFVECLDLTNVVIGDGVRSIGLGAFENCGSLTNVVISDSVTSIGQEAFAFCTSLTSVTIPDSVTNLGDFAFEACGLTNVVIGTNVISIGDYAFNQCDSLTSVTIPDSVTSLGDEAFIGCESLANVVIGNGVTTIGDSAFSECESLTNVVIGDGVRSIGDAAFYQCFGLTRVAIPDSVTSIGANAFSESGLTSVTIPNSVTSIADEGLGSCYYLTSVTIGSGITNLYGDTFDRCPNLASVTFLGNAPVISNSGDGITNLFASRTNVTVYIDPGTTGWDSFAANQGVVVASVFNTANYGGLPVLLYPTSDGSNIVQMSTNPASGIWVTVSNVITLSALQLTNQPATGFFRLQSSDGGAPDAGLAFYGNLPVLFYPANTAYTLLMSTGLAAPSWSRPSGNAFITVQVTNAPPGAVFRLH